MDSDREQVKTVNIDFADTPKPVKLDYLLQLNNNLNQALKDKEKELNEVRELLAHTAKLSNLGTMGAEIAHELNNPLTVVNAEAEEILDAVTSRAANSDLITECAQNIRKSAERMRKIVDYVRHYARQDGEASWQHLNINDPIHNALILLRPQLVNSGIEVRLALGENLPQILGDANKLESVFQNLIMNARDAFLQIRDKRHKTLNITTLSDNNSVIIKIADNAGGIPGKIKENIFQPFFTTKKAGQGTGLGLAITRQLLKEHNADIELNSEEGKGSEFVISFPRELRG